MISNRTLFTALALFLSVTAQISNASNGGLFNRADLDAVEQARRSGNVQHYNSANSRLSSNAAENLRNTPTNPEFTSLVNRPGTLLMMPSSQRPEWNYWERRPLPPENPYWR